MSKSGQTDVGGVCLVPATLKPVTVKNVVKYTNDLKARDKLLRFVQYTSKLLIFRLREADAKSEVAARLELLSKGIGLHRKAFKLGAFLDEYHKFTEALKSGKQDLKRSLTLVLRACMFCFVILDNLIYFISLKVLKLDKDPLKLKAYRFRLVGALLNTAISVIDMQAQGRAVETLRAKDKEGSADLDKATAKQGQNFVGLAKNACDVVTYLNSAEVLKAVLGAGLRDDTNGAIGAVSALAALYGIWMKM